MGFCWEKNSYLRDSWNQLDFIIVVFSILDASVQSINIPFIKIVRLIRILRPLRFISHNVNMKLMITALMESVAGVLNVIIVLLLVM